MPDTQNATITSTIHPDVAPADTPPGWKIEPYGDQGTWLVFAPFGDHRGSYDSFEEAVDGSWVFFTDEHPRLRKSPRRMQSRL